MKEENKNPIKAILDKQCKHWDEKLSNIPDMFGKDPSETVRKALELFKGEGVRKILELGGGQGRDTIYFAANGLEVHSLDYSESGVRNIRKRATESGLGNRLTAMRHDIRQPLPFDDAFFDACYSHMFFCMALTTLELELIFAGIRRVLKPDGLIVYTVRNTEDPHYGQGIHRGEDLYEKNGFIVHFFSMEMVEYLSGGFEIVNVERCEESSLPRRLFRVILRRIPREMHRA
jgi:SAM-dependent methyltransferase